MNVIGIFGGTFDPFHNAHLYLAKAFRDEIGLTSLHVIPTGIPSHRPYQPQTATRHRLNIVKLGVANEPRMLVDDRETRRSRPSYTIETLQELSDELGEQISLWLLIGSDSLAQLSSWKDWQQLFDLANLAVAMRPGSDVNSWPEEIQQQWKQRKLTGTAPSPLRGAICPLKLPPNGLSATVVRKRLASQLDVSHLISPEILHYIKKHGLYVNKGKHPHETG